MVKHMKYPNNIKKNYKKEINYKNRGMDLENLINEACKYYLEHNLAVIYKKHTPIGIVDVDYKNGAVIISMNEHYFLFKGSDLITFIHNNTRKSIPFKVIENLGYLLKFNYNIGLDYLTGIKEAYEGVGYFENTKD